jgi:hypothetical protein
MLESNIKGIREGNRLLTHKVNENLRLSIISYELYNIRYVTNINIKNDNEYD